jgi:hypothetical protein
MTHVESFSARPIKKCRKKDLTSQWKNGILYRTLTHVQSIETTLLSTQMVLGSRTIAIGGTV